MTIDERLEKLTERQALTQSVEILSSDLQKTRALVDDIAVGIAGLLNVAESRERRLTRLEGNAD
jgi:hypothetical protein